MSTTPTSVAVGTAIGVAAISLLTHTPDMPVVGVNAADPGEGATSTHVSSELSRSPRPSSSAHGRRHGQPRPTSEAPRRPAPTPASRSSARPALPSPPTAARGGGPTSEQWWHLRNCEADGNYATNTGNGYYGAYQFDIGTWRGVLDRLGITFRGLPSDASPDLQDRAAQALYDDRGRAPWPHCGLLWLP